MNCCFSQNYDNCSEKIKIMYKVQTMIKYLSFRISHWKLKIENKFIFKYQSYIIGIVLMRPAIQNDGHIFQH